MIRFLILCFLFVFSSSPVASEQLRIEGTGDSQQLIKALAVAFERTNPEIQVIVPSSVGSSGGIRLLIQGRTDLARIARNLKSKELRQEPGLKVHQFALSPVLFVANLPDSCVQEITSDEVRGILSGKLSNWSDLGDCPDQKIYVANREAGDSSRTVIEQNYPELKTLKNWAGREVFTTPETAKTISDHPYTFGYLPAPLVRPELTVFTVDSIAATPENVTTRHYPFITVFSLVSLGPLTSKIQQFLDFTGSEEARQIMRAMNVVPVAGIK